MAKRRVSFRGAEADVFVRSVGEGGLSIEDAVSIMTGGGLEVCSYEDCSNVVSVQDLQNYCSECGGVYCAAHVDYRIHGCERRRILGPGV